MKDIGRLKLVMRFMTIALVVILVIFSVNLKSSFTKIKQ